jgi:hypothetical protein
MGGRANGAMFALTDTSAHAVARPWPCASLAEATQPTAHPVKDESIPDWTQRSVG